MHSQSDSEAAYEEGVADLQGTMVFKTSKKFQNWVSGQWLQDRMVNIYNAYLNSMTPIVTALSVLYIYQSCLSFVHIITDTVLNLYILIVSEVSLLLLIFIIFVCYTYLHFSHFYCNSGINKCIGANNIIMFI